MTLADLAERLGCRLEGDGTIQVFRVVGIEDAGPGELTFLANPKYASKLAGTRASAIIVDESVSAAPCAMLRTNQPYLAFAEAVAVLTPIARPTPGISPLAAIDPTARLGPDVTVAPFVSIGPRAHVGARTVLYPHVVVGADATIGAECVVHAQASIREGVELGRRVVVQDGAVIGSDGFGFARRRDGSRQKIPQVGRVVIEDDVEIGAHSAIDRPAIGETRVGAGTKIDNLVQIGHGVKIGRNVVLVGQAGIAGSTTLEDDVVMAAQSGVTGHVRIGRGTVVGGRAGVTKDVEPMRRVAGFPATDVEAWRESVVLVRRLGHLRKTLADLVDRVRKLEEQK